LLVYVGGAALLTRRFVAAPKQRAQSEHRQKASRTDGVVIAIAFVFAAFVYGFIANRVLWIPIVGDAWIAFVRSRPPFGATTIANVVLYVVVPTLVLLRVGSALVQTPEMRTALQVRMAPLEDPAASGLVSE